MNSNLTMKNCRKIGIWMDHSNAFLIEFNHSLNKTGTVDWPCEKYVVAAHGENWLLRKEKQQLFYIALVDKIKDYEEVLLLGPYTKAELWNIIINDERFSNIKFDANRTEKMTENQLHSFVGEYFTRSRFD